jgi:hypothetical protein
MAASFHLPFQAPHLSPDVWAARVTGTPASELGARVAEWMAEVTDWWWPMASGGDGLDAAPLWLTALPLVERTSAVVNAAIREVELQRTSVGEFMLALVADPVLRACPSVRAALREWVCPSMATADGVERLFWLAARSGTQAEEIGLRTALLRSCEPPLFSVAELLTLTPPPSAPTTAPSIDCTTPPDGNARRTRGRTSAARVAAATAVLERTLMERTVRASVPMRMAFSVAVARTESDLLAILDAIDRRSTPPPTLASPAPGAAQTPAVSRGASTAPWDDDDAEPALNQPGSVPYWFLMPLAKHPAFGPSIIDRLCAMRVLGRQSANMLSLRADVLHDETRAARLLTMVRTMTRDGVPMARASADPAHSSSRREGLHDASVLQRLVRSAPPRVARDAFRDLAGARDDDLSRTVFPSFQHDPARVAPWAEDDWLLVRQAMQQVLEGERGLAQHAASLYDSLAALFPYLTSARRQEIVTLLLDRGAELEPLVAWLTEDLPSTLQTELLPLIAPRLAAESNSATRAAVIMRLGAASDPAPRTSGTAAARRRSGRNR